MRILIFGANGQTGRLLTRHALDAGHAAVAVTRRPREFPFTHPGLTVVGADVHDAHALVDAAAGTDAVVSTLGVPFTRQAVHTYSAGTANIAGAMQTTGVRRLVVVSSTGAFPPSARRTGAPFLLRLVEPVISRTIGKTVYDDIRRMEPVVHDSGLDWTIVRPSGLFDLPRVTKYFAAEGDPISPFTSRTDLADYLLASAGRPGGKDTVTISTTVDTPTVWQMVRKEAL